MSQHVVDLAGAPEIIDTNHLLVSGDDGLRLRKLGGNGLWSPGGAYSAGQITLDTWSPGAMRSLTGFLAIGDVPAGDQLLFRLSPDGGTTVLWWDGSAWSVATDPTLDWNPEDVIDAHIASFPVQTGVTQIVRLVSGSGTTTPKLKETRVFWEGGYDSTVDLLNSLARKMATDFVIDGEFRVTLPIPPVPQIPPVPPPGGPPPTVTAITVVDPLFLVSEPIQVFNVTNDPSMRSDLFASLSGNVITLTSGQTTGQVNVYYSGRMALARIHVSTDVDFEKAELPAAVIQTPSSIRVRYERTLEDNEEPLRSLGVVRTLRSPTFQDVTVNVQCNAAWDLHGRKMSDTLRAFFEHLSVLTSIATGEEMPISMLGPFTKVESFVEQIHTFNVPLVVTVLDCEAAFRDYTAATAVAVNTWPSALGDTTPDVTETDTCIPQVDTIEQAFTWRSTSPLDFGILLAGYEILDTDVVITAAFNDGAASLDFGLRSAPGGILPTSAIDPQAVGTYNSQEDLVLGAADELRLRIVPGSSTQGAGRVVVTIKRSR